MTNKETAEKIFDTIQSNHFTPININYENGYFIFDMGEDSVVRFEIKGLHGWKFAIWIDRKDGELEYPSVQFFCQHILNIDKFKPSRSFFLADIEPSYFKNEGLIKYRIMPIIKMIKRHPFVSFAMDANESQYYNGSYFGKYVEIKSYRIINKMKNWWNDTITKIWHGTKVWFIKRYKVVDTVKFIDKNSGGFICSPRSELHIHFKELSKDEETQSKAELKVLNRWFKKNYYYNLHINLTREGIEGSYFYQ